MPQTSPTPPSAERAARFDADIERDVLTDKEWREFQRIPEQGYSHRAWVDARIAERVTQRDEQIAALQQIVASGEIRVLGGEPQMELALRTNATQAEQVAALQAQLGAIRAWAEVSRYKNPGDRDSWSQYAGGIDAAQGEVLDLLGAARAMEPVSGPRPEVMEAAERVRSRYRTALDALAAE